MVMTINRIITFPKEDEKAVQYLSTNDLFNEENSILIQIGNFFILKTKVAECEIDNNVVHPRPNGGLKIGDFTWHPICCNDRNIDGKKYIEDDAETENTKCKANLSDTNKDETCSPDCRNKPILVRIGDKMQFKYFLFLKTQKIKHEPSNGQLNDENLPYEDKKDSNLQDSVNSLSLVPYLSTLGRRCQSISSTMVDSNNSSTANNGEAEQHRNGSETSEFERKENEKHILKQREFQHAPSMQTNESSSKFKKGSLCFCRKLLKDYISLLSQGCIASGSVPYIFYPLDGSYQSPIMRLHSFRNWPQDSAIGATRLVDNGFACIDNDLQKVECISCGFQLIITELEGRDLNTVHREHSPDCPFANGRRHVATVLEDGLQQVLNREESSRPSHPYTGLAQTDAFLSSRLQTTVTLSSISDTNVNVNSSEQSQTEQAAIATQSINNANTLQGAIGHSAYSIRNPAQTTSEARRQTFMYWPHAGEQDIDLLVDAGFFFTGTEDVVRCFYCDIGLAEWNADDDPFIEHARHSPDCPYLRDKKGQDYINQVQQDWARIYTPKRPELSQMNTRLRTFENQSWPRDQVAQTPQQLANAGFYYTGEGDTVRCHYCDGGLREWEPNDDPWVEHAKWFPFCKFVLKVKGIQFIQMSATGTPSVAPTVQSQNLPSTFVEPALRMSYVDECRRKEQRNPLLSAAAQSVKSMGYTRSTVWLSINSYIEKTGRRDFKARDLLDIILEREDKGEILRDDDILDRPQPNNEPSAISAAAAERDDGEEEMELTPEALRKENQFLVQKFKCLVCRDKDRCIVYVPCGHRIVCEPCGKEQKCCSHCGVKVERRVKTYLC